MITKELKDYIQQEFTDGITKDIIKKTLSEKGWSEQDLNDAFIAIEKPQPVQTFTPPPVVKSQLQNEVGNIIQKSEQPPAASSSGHKGLWAFAIVVILLIICASGAFAAYHYGLLSARLFTSTATTTPSFATTAATSTSALISPDGSIQWRSLVSAIPVKMITATSSPNHNSPAEFALYDIGTFLTGPYAGLHLYFANDEKLFSYGYFAGDSSGNPKVWWGDWGFDYEFADGVSQLLGLQNLPIAPEDSFPLQLELPGLHKAFNDPQMTDSNGNMFRLLLPVFIPDPSNTFSSSTPPTIVPIVPNTLVMGGNIIAREPLHDDASLFGRFFYLGFSGEQPTYYIKTPIGIIYGAQIITDLDSRMEMTTTTPKMVIPNVSWAQGATTTIRKVQVANMSDEQDCYKSFKDFNSFRQALINTGMTSKGSSVYEINPVGHDDVYRCLYKDLSTYDTANGSISYKDFLKMHPEFFWQDPYGNWYVFTQDDLFTPRDSTVITGGG